MPIKIEHLSFIYNPKTTFQKAALEDITVTIEDGDFFGIVGHTGSGKSTLVSHLNALSPVTAGSIFIDDVALHTLKKSEYKRLRAKVGMVFQYPEYQLFDETVAKDVAFGPRNLGLPDEEINERVREAIALVGLEYDAVCDRSPFELSGGQMRRAALAGVLAMRPEILILDEPTAGLDPRGKKEIMQLIRRYKSRCNIVIMISHNMDEVAACCNRIAVLSHGRLYGVFSPRELFSQKELLVSLRLEMPSVTALADALAARGLAVDPTLVDEEALIEALVSACVKGGGHA